MKTQTRKRKYVSKAATSVSRSYPVGLVRPRRENYSAVSRIPGFPLPPRLLCEFVYSDYATLPISAGVGTTKVYNLNSLYAPEASGGHQPLWRDQLLGVFYNRYKVWKIEWEVQWSFNTNGNSAVIAVVPVNGPGPTSPTTEQLIELPRVQWRQFSLGGPNLPIKGSVYLPALTGVTKAHYDGGNDYGALYSGSPVEVMSLVVGADSPTQMATAGGYFQVRLRYVSELYDPIQSVGQS